jgi:hypothetical protein
MAVYFLDLPGHAGKLKKTESTQNFICPRYGLALIGNSIIENLIEI